MTCKTDTAVVRTIGIDTGNNTLHMIGRPRSHSSLACPV
jgi:hypothetical protein